MWFGTQDYSLWVPTPLSGADVSPKAWGDNGTLLNGSGYALNSFNSHKEYNFSWRQSSSREVAQRMKSFFDGSYGRGKIYFIDPLTMDMNVLPARWADPSITCDFEGPRLVPGVDPTSVANSGFETFGLPVRAAQFNLAGATPVSSTAPVLNDSNSVYIPIPDGYTLHLGANYSSTSSLAGVYYTPISQGGVATSTSYRLIPLDNATNVLSNSYSKQPGIIGVRVWIGKTSSTTATVTVGGMSAVLYPTGVNLLDREPRWYGGQGNAGVRFAGPPTYINHNGRDGGQVEYAATFVESIL